MGDFTAFLWPCLSLYLDGAISSWKGRKDIHCSCTEKVGGKASLTTPGLRHDAQHSADVLGLQLQGMLLQLSLDFDIDHWQWTDQLNQVFKPLVDIIVMLKLGTLSWLHASVNLAHREVIEKPGDDWRFL